MAARKPKTRTIKAAGKKPITFKEGGLHQSTGTPAGKPIPAAKMRQALSGTLGPRAHQQANFAKNVLGAGRGTAAANRSGGKSAGKAASGGK